MHNKFRTKTHLYLALACGWCLLAPAGLVAKEPPEQHAEIQTAREDGTMIISSDQEVVLEGVIYPNPLTAGAWINRLAGRAISYRSMGVDRYGHKRIIAHVTADETMQQAIIRDGRAVAYSAEPLPDISIWMKQEAVAEKIPCGIWPKLVITPDKAEDFVGQFKLVKGKVTHVYAAKEATYLNFGDDWKSDFSVTISKRALKAFGAKLNGIEGKTVRVRGALYKENGPMIELTQPEQLEILHGQS